VRWVSAVTGTETSPAELLRAACGGDSRAFQALVAPHVRALHLHSYRMLGSYVEAEDAVQETLLRAWQGLAGFEGRARWTVRRQVAQARSACTFSPGWGKASRRRRR
jgi:DNA-directed RNA polymerase specialized sigma24 family protein